MERKFRHPDGRSWSIEVCGTDLAITIVLPDDDEPIHRSVACGGTAQALAREAELVREQLEDGFLELTPPPWRAALDRWIASWRAAGPDLEGVVDEWVERAEALPDLEARVLAVLDATERWDAKRGGTALDMDDAIHGLPARTAALRADRASLPIVLLALRDDGDGSYARVMQLSSIARTEAPPTAAPLLFSLVERPPAHMVDATLFERFFDPGDDAQVARVLAAMRSADWRVAHVGAWIAATFGARRDALFDELWSRRRTCSPDFWPFAALRACVVRRDRGKLADLEAWRTSARGPLRRTIDDAIAALRA